MKQQSEFILVRDYVQDVLDVRLSGYMSVFNLSLVTYPRMSPENSLYVKTLRVHSGYTPEQFPARWLGLSSSVVVSESLRDY